MHSNTTIVKLALLQHVGVQTWRNHVYLRKTKVANPIIGYLLHVLSVVIIDPCYQVPPLPRPQPHRYQARARRYQRCPITAIPNRQVTAFQFEIILMTKTSKTSM